MDTINTGGPAFPVIAENGLGHVADGMDLRDYFAAKALQGLLANMEFMPVTTIERARTREQMAAEISASVYRIADAMIAARGA